MRSEADASKIRSLMAELGRAARGPGHVYFAGGATAVLLGWRAATIDVDLKFDPEAPGVFEALPRLKDELELNVELASPADFVPVPEGWEDRSVFAAREGRLTFYHFDPYAQALAKLERAHALDLRDVPAMVGAGLVVPAQALAYFREIEPELYRFPAVDPRSFRRRVEEAFRPGSGDVD
jgi:hypothetical protein